MKKTIIVMPVANEESTMGQILDEILELPYDRLYVYPVVDDYSKDRTEAIIREREKHSDKVKMYLLQRINRCDQLLSGRLPESSCRWRGTDT